jgi:3-oxoisoapionate decarboxylase
VRIGLSSYSYTWAVGVAGSPPDRPLSPFELVELAHSLGVEVLQIADNVALHRFSASELTQLAGNASDIGLAIEVGTRGVEPTHLDRYLALAELFGSPLLRVIIAGAAHNLSVDEAIAIIKPQRDAFERAGVKLAIENHDRYSTQELSHIVEELGVTWAGICLDTVNSFGALEGPAAVVDQLGPFVINLHVKDFVVQRASHMMGFTVEGRPVGQGQLNVPWLLERLNAYDRDISGIVELWTPPQDTVQETIVLERTWAEASVNYLKALLLARS